MRLILNCIIDIVAACFGISGRRVRMILSYWKLFLIGTLLTFTLGFVLIYTDAQYNARSVSKSKVNQEISEKVVPSYRVQYGVEIEVDESIFFSSDGDKYYLQQKYLGQLCETSSSDYYLVHLKEKPPETKFVCVQGADGKVVDSYFYDKMIELANGCGLGPYLKQNTYKAYYNTYATVDLQKYFGPAFVSLKVKSQSEDFYSKWDKYVQKLRDEETIWRERENLYVLFDGKIGESLKYKISRVKDEKADQKQMKKLKKWINKPHRNDVVDE